MQGLAPCVAALVAVLGPTVPAHADASAAAVEWWGIQNLNSGLFLAVSGSSDANGAPIVQANQGFQPNGLPSLEQAWTPVSKGGGYLSLRNAGTSDWKALAIGASSTANGATAIQWTYQSTNHDQQWLKRNHSDGFELVNRNSGKCLAIPGGNKDPGISAIQWPCNGGKEQRWVQWSSA